MNNCLSMNDIKSRSHSCAPVHQDVT